MALIPFFCVGMEGAWDTHRSLVTKRTAGNLDTDGSARTGEGPDSGSPTPDLGGPRRGPVMGRGPGAEAVGIPWVFHHPSSALHAGLRFPLEVSRGITGWGTSHLLFHYFPSPTKRSLACLLRRKGYPYRPTASGSFCGTHSLKAPTNLLKLNDRGQKKTKNKQIHVQFVTVNT